MSGIKDVAKRAGVGVGTVSRMLNNSGYVAEATREKIREAMAELNYTPNELARNLYRKRSGIIAVLVPDIVNPFFSEFVDWAESELHGAGFKMMVCNTARQGNAEMEYLDMLNRHIVDGIISGVHSLDVGEYLKIDKPIVALDRYLGDNIPEVSSNHTQGGALAAGALLGSGCRKVLHFKGDTVVESPYHKRHYEFDRIMKEHGVEVTSYELMWNRFDTAYFDSVIGEIFSNSFEFDGIFAVDWLAVKCLNECARRGVSVPSDVRIVAYDGTFITQLVEPALTAVVQPVSDLAKVAVGMLVDVINGGELRGRRVELDVTLRVGGTTLVL